MKKVVAERNCAPPNSKVESHISDRCSCYTGSFSWRYENHIGLDSYTVQCGGTISVIYVWRVTYRIGVHAISDSFSCQHRKLSSIVCLNLRLVKILTSQTMKHLEICLQTCKLKRCEDLRETVRNGRR